MWWPPGYHGRHQGRHHRGGHHRRGHHGGGLLCLHPPVTTPGVDVPSVDEDLDGPEEDDAETGQQHEADPGGENICRNIDRLGLREGFINP